MLAIGLSFPDTPIEDEEEKMQISNLRIGQKLFLILALSILIVFVIAGYVIRSTSNRFAEETSSSVSASANKQVMNTVQVFAGELGSSADRVMGALVLGYPERFRLDESAAMRIGDRTVPSLFSGSRLINQEHASLDRFLAQTKSVATVFVRDGNDFVR